MTTTPSLLARFLAEVLGTFLLVLFGCGAVHCAVLTGDLVGLWQVGIVWGLAIVLAIYAIGPISGAHINPAITVGLAAWGQFPWRSVPPYVSAQFAGAFAAPTAAQVQGWATIAAGQHTLILAPTGSGKTLAAFLACLDRLMFEPVPPPAERCRALSR